LSKVKIKICGIKNSNIFDYCDQNMIDYAGLIFYKKSPRYINIDTAINILKSNYKISTVGVFVDEKINFIIEFINKLNLKFVQLHGSEDNEYIKKIKSNSKVSVIKNIAIRESIDLNQIENYPLTDYLLLDYKPNKNELPGGNAKSFNWDILKDVKFNKPWFISGGININNINKILNNLDPYGIDISSGVEDKPGIKNVKKIKQIMDIINE
tara:strand:+ start:2010 stop:2642 length:633 start_codon:yes stop_codon:yes gene_type:complete